MARRCNSSASSRTMRRRRVRPVPATCYCLFNLLLLRQGADSLLLRPTHVQLAASCLGSAQPRQGQWASSSLAATAGGHTQDGQEEVRVPDVLRDLVVEQIEELGGGKVTEVMIENGLASGCKLVGTGNTCAAALYCTYYVRFIFQ